MRYMIIVKTTEPAPPPSSDLIAAMGKFNDELIEAGVLLVAEGLQPSKSGAKVKKQAGKVVVQDGPFTEAKELIGGFWIIKADSMQQAIDWAARVPLDDGTELEIRRVSEVTDFVRDDVSAEALDHEQAFREKTQGS